MQKPEPIKIPKIDHILYPPWPKKYGNNKILRQKFLDGFDFEDKNDKVYKISDFPDGITVKLVARGTLCSIILTIGPHHRLSAELRKGSS